jgi:hypothetical protein
MSRRCVLKSFKVKYDLPGVAAMHDIYCTIERSGKPISTEEWTRVVAADSELEFSTTDSLMYLDEQGCSCEAYAVNWTGDSDCTFLLVYGRISAEGAKDSVVDKARQVALALNAMFRLDRCI